MPPLPDGQLPMDMMSNPMHQDLTQMPMQPMNYDGLNP